MEKLLADILRRVDYTAVPAIGGLTIRSVAADSRKVEAGTLFVCVQGKVADGHDFIEAAVVKGAVAIVANRERMGTIDSGHALPVVWVDDTRQVIGDIAAAFYDYPADSLTLIGLTGTNGKTTTSFILEAIVRAAGGQPGIIGTINYRYGGREVPAGFTTPEPLELQALLREMADHGVTHVIMEVSSHALAMHRLQGVMFDAVLFTNLTRDHLDFHEDMEAYYQAKKRLFTDYLRPRGVAVVLVEEAAEDEAKGGWGRRLYDELAYLRQHGEDRLLRCGIGLGHDISAHDATFGLEATTAIITAQGWTFTVSTNLVGVFNLKNVLGAIGVAVGLDLDPAVIARGLAGPIRVPGRLEKVAVDDAPGLDLPTVFVDYAHTPDALHNVLLTLRQLHPERLLVVFGCGGDRDPGKRRIMGEIAGQSAEVVIITADNSRSESTEAIMAEIEKGVVAAGQKAMAGSGPSAAGYTAIRGRSEAISAAIAMAGGKDIVLISGKGHETYQISAQGTVFFDDRLEAARCLKNRAVQLIGEGRQGP